MSSGKDIQTLKKIIKEEVFITDGQERIVSQGGIDSQWLFDFRSIFLNPHHINLIADIFWETHKDKYPFQVGGLEVASVPLLSAIVTKSIEKGKPIHGFFIRKSRKKDGLLKMIEGKMTDDPIILVDDVINSGRTFIRQLEVIEGIGREVQSIFTILRFRNSDYYDFAHDRGIKITSLFTLPDFGHKFRGTRKQKLHYQPFDVQWYFKSEDPNFFHVVPKSAPTLDGKHVYFGSDSGNFWALKQGNGSVVWKYKVGFHPKGKGIFSTPIVHNSTVYFGAYDGNMYALDTKTGRRKWIFMEADWIGSSPAIAENIDTLFVGLEFGLWKKRGGIVALDLETGEKKWEYIMPEYTHGSPAYHPNKKVVAIGSNDGVAYLFNAKNGKLIWKYQTGGEIKGTPVFDLERNYIIYGSYNGELNIFNLSGKLLHTHKADFAIFSNPLVKGNNVYAASADKKLYCIDLDTFKEKWVFTASVRIFASPAIVDDKLYIGANDARLHEIDLETGKETSFFQVTERITNRIAYNPETKRFFLPTFANEIYCLEKKTEKKEEKETQDKK